MIKISKIISLLLIIIGNEPAYCQTSNPEVKIHYLGHSSFVLSFNDCINIVTDYGKENAWLEWGWDSKIYSINDLVPDIMTFSHNHDDHFDLNRIPNGVKHILRDTDKLIYKGITITPIRTCESDISVESNTSYIFEYNGMKICHLGDTQAQIMNIDNTEVANNIKNIFPDQIDLLFMTIEGQQKFIPQAEAFLSLIKPQKAILMHYWSNEYLQDFISYLKKKNKFDNKYKLSVADNSKYLLMYNENKETIEIIILERGPYKMVQK